MKVGWTLACVALSTPAPAAPRPVSVDDLMRLRSISDEYFGPPWESSRAYTDHSPITHASKVATPLLIQHGENDRRVPVSQARKFYEALKGQGKTVEMEIYPRGGHVIYEPDLQAEIMRRNLEWFRKWIVP